MKLKKDLSFKFDKMYMCHLFIGENLKTQINST